MYIGKFEGEQEGKNTTIEYYVVALDRNVLAVAKAKYYDGSLFDWASYIGAVEGKDHIKEYLKVAKIGSKQHKEEAKVFFSMWLPMDKYRC